MTEDLELLSAVTPRPEPQTPHLPTGAGLPREEHEALATFLVDFIASLDRALERTPGDLPNRRGRRAHHQRRFARASWLMAEHDRRREAWQSF